MIFFTYSIVAVPDRTTELVTKTIQATVSVTAAVCEPIGEDNKSVNIVSH